MFKIKNWDDIYENNRSRTVKDLSWVPIPNRHDGEAYSRLMLQKDAPIIFTVWILLLQVASRCQPRGSLLTSSCQPHNAETLSIKTRAKVEWFEKSLPFLVQIGWLEEERQETDSVLSASCQQADSVVTKKERKKEWKERTEGVEGFEYPKDFLGVWNVYPNKQGKLEALKAWKRLKPEEGLKLMMLKAIEIQKKWPQWTKEGGKFIPHFSTWINQMRWEDEGISKVNGARIRPSMEEIQNG